MNTPRVSLLFIFAIDYDLQQESYKASYYMSERFQLPYNMFHMIIFTLHFIVHAGAES